MSDGYQATKEILNDTRSLEDLIEISKQCKVTWEKIVEEQKAGPYRLPILIATLAEVQSAFHSMAVATKETLEALQTLSGEHANV